MTPGVVEASTTQWIVGLAAIVGFLVLYVVMAFVMPLSATRNCRRCSALATVNCRAVGHDRSHRLLPVSSVPPSLVGPGAGWLAFPILAGVVAALWAVLGGSDQLRELAISEENLEWRTIRRRGLVPLDQVVAVTDPARTGEPPEVWLSDGSLLQLPASEEALPVARTLAGCIGQPWPPAVPDAADPPSGAT